MRRSTCSPRRAPAPSAGRARNFGGSFHAAVDGFDIRGGDQQGFPGNINDLTGAPTGLPANITTQGGAIFANAFVKNLQITNNVVENNGGGYGTIRIGTPDLAGSDANQHNEGVRIADNRIVSNAGTNLAGAVGLFGGSDGYEVSGNDICGNFSLEYGAGVSVYGSSPGGKIHHNRIYFNNSNDEGAGIMIAGALPANPNALSPGTGAVDIYNNLIQGNLANDDGGGIRFLMSGNYPMNVTNNTIVNNVSTHEGAGVAINDAPNVRLVNNTIMKNTTTATAVTSDGTPAPAGVSTSLNSDQLQATLPTGSKSYSDPVLFNNILWDNRAGTRAGHYGDRHRPGRRLHAGRALGRRSVRRARPADAHALRGPAGRGPAPLRHGRQQQHGQPRRGLDLRHLGVLRHLAPEPRLRRRHPGGRRGSGQPAR